MFQPGQDYNYPTSSGNTPAGLLSQSFTFQGHHITFAAIAIVVSMVIIYQMARKRR